uniref:Uncharacterized protein n=1 Tax=Ciona savignyi TaxID=51511 RepID=H2YWB1_CIOSA
MYLVFHLILFFLDFSSLEHVHLALRHFFLFLEHFLLLHLFDLFDLLPFLCFTFLDLLLR